MNRSRIAIAALIAAMVATAVVAALLPRGAASPAGASSVSRVTPTIVRVVPHDPGAFTQGVEFVDATTYVQSAGRTGQSTIALVDLDSGAVKRVQPLPDSEFGEGATVVGDSIVQLTWKSGIAHRWNAATLEPLPSWTYAGEGWGLCNDTARKVIWRSDGSATLTAHDPSSFAVVRTTDVTLDGAPLTELNELECASDGVWANVWHTDQIVRIDPESGRVGAVVDASSLAKEARAKAGADGLGPEDVLNGIAVIPGSGQWFVTGKNWPVGFVVEPFTTVSRS